MNLSKRLIRLPRRGLILIAAGLMFGLSRGGPAAAQDSSLLRNPGPAAEAAVPPTVRGGASGRSPRANLPAEGMTGPPQPGGGYGRGYGGGYGRRSPTRGYGLSLPQSSWTYKQAPSLRTFAKNDIVTIRVDEIARVLAEGEAESRKQTEFEAILTDWIKISKGRLRPDPQENGDPAVANETNNRFRSESIVESRESLTFNIAARVVDIRPNGNLVLEASKTFRVNDNLWETSLSGICRGSDVGPDNVVLSRDLIDLQINKQDRGHLRDGYRRGWFTRWFDRFQPF